MVLKCYNYMYNESSRSPCLGSFEQCAKLVECKIEGSPLNSLCFALAKPQTFNDKHNTNNDSTKLNILSAGCYHPDGNLGSESCSKDQCLGNYRPNANQYYCCCTEDGCNQRIIPKPKPPTTSSIILPNSRTSSSSITASDIGGSATTYNNQNAFHSNSNSQQLTSFNQSVVYIVVILILAITVILGAFYRRTRLKRRAHGLDVRVGTGSGNKANHNHGNDVSVLTPFRNSFNSESQYQYGQNEENNPNNIHNYISRANNDNTLNNNYNAQQRQCPKFDIEDVELLELVGSGRFGTVHKANLARHDKNERPSVALRNGSGGGDEVDDDVEARRQLITSEIAVKIIPNNEYQSWQNELKIYNSTRTRHPNVLTFLGTCESPQTNSNWLLVEYASNGSLHHYLKENPITWDEFLMISLGIVRGLSHLHDADIAHRDFKSKNVLLRNNLSPCITDFGVASMLDTTGGSQTEQRKKYLQVGTPRYMAPEVLECSVAFTKISFTKIDVYALSLVLWELLSRCHPLPKLRMNDYDDTLMSAPSMYVQHTTSPIQYRLTNPNQIASTPLGGVLYQPHQVAINLNNGPSDQLQQQPAASYHHHDSHIPQNSAAGTAKTMTTDVMVDQSLRCGEQEQLKQQPAAAAMASSSLRDDTPPYKMPFEDAVGPNPDINTMRQAVVSDKLRPSIRPEWRYYPVSKVCQAIVDGWEYDHDARISASCFVERIETLVQQQQLPQQLNNCLSKDERPKVRSSAQNPSTMITTTVT